MVPSQSTNLREDDFPRRGKPKAEVTLGPGEEYFNWPTPPTSFAHMYHMGRCCIFFRCLAHLFFVIRSPLATASVAQRFAWLDDTFRHSFSGEWLHYLTLGVHCGSRFVSLQVGSRMLQRMGCVHHGTYIRCRAVRPEKWRAASSCLVRFFCPDEHLDCLCWTIFWFSAFRFLIFRGGGFAEFVWQHTRSHNFIMGEEVERDWFAVVLLPSCLKFDFSS